MKAAIDKVHSDSDISSNLDINHELDMDKAAEDSLLGENFTTRIQNAQNGAHLDITFDHPKSPPVKKDKTVRYCLDYRDLNAKTTKDRWPLPSIRTCLDTLEGNEWFSTLDLAAGYWQFLIEEQDIPKTAFLTKFGLFEHVRMAFGLTNAPSFCQRAVELVLRGMT